ncbi:MAG: hypothetical protein Q8O46_02185, partial [bacterium]|nr:hypothetical protein [bacterium]
LGAVIRLGGVPRTTQAAGSVLVSVSRKVWLFYPRRLELRCATLPNMAVKGTRRPGAVLKFYVFQGLVTSLIFCDRHAHYLYVRRSGVKIVGFDLSSSASVVAGSFLVCFGLALQACCLGVFFRVSASSVGSHSLMRLRHARGELGLHLCGLGLPRTTQAASPVFG